MHFKMGNQYNTMNNNLIILCVIITIYHYNRPYLWKHYNRSPPENMRFVALCIWEKKKSMKIFISNQLHDFSAVNKFGFAKNAL